MVRLILPALIWMIALEVGQANAQQFPYVAFVAEADAYVRSGPGQKYYPTQQLPQGFAVEVYRHDGEGWCAIRPPEGSFSWIPAPQSRVVNQAVAEVVGEGVVTRIGSTLSAARSTVQVLLPRGERVEILAGQPTDDPGWLRIAAPAGEFRWIAAQQLSRQPPLEAAPPTPSPSPSGWTNQSTHNSVLATTAEQPTIAFGHLQVETVATAGFGAPSNAASTPVEPNAIDVVAGSPAETQLASNNFESSVPSAVLSSPPRIRFRGLSSSDGATVERVEELQLRLSQTVIRPPQEWSFDQLESEANSLLEKTKSPRVRSQLRDILDRIARFGRVRQGYEEFAVSSRTGLEAVRPTQLADEGFTGMTSKVRQLAKADLAASKIAAGTNRPLYDAVGLLKPVASKRPKAPQYALVDDKGEVVSFITPSPDLNLQPYLGRRIGVHGKRGFMPEYRRAHVTAERISPIEGRLRR